MKLLTQALACARYIKKLVITVKLMLQHAK